MKIFILLSFFLVPGIFTANATHIVGGGFSYRVVGQNTYRFTLTLYFDYLNGNLAAKDSEAKCYIFRKSDNRLIDSLYMTLVDSNRFLPFTNPACGAKVNLKTQVLQYANNIQMGFNRFSSSSGYYIIWERCCRNNIISNIMLPEATGQVFYMEFPPVIRNNIPFINNSPVFDVIRSDYPCFGEFFELPFGATDPDGDQLIYSLTNPLKGNSTPTIPAGTPAIPGPYDPVLWNFGFNATNPLKGNPGLTVNQTTGLLKCRATLVGLFVFSVKCEEFRNGIKIGEVRREMQIQVVDCPINTKPDIIIRSEQSGGSLADEDTLYITGGSKETCKPIGLVDLQRNEPIRLQLIPISPNAPSSLSDLKNLFIGTKSDSVFSSFCIPACSFSTVENPWRVLIVATDNGCSVPKSDSLYLNLVVRPGPAFPPSIQTTDTQPDTIVVLQTGSINVPIKAIQSQAATLIVFSTLEDSQGNLVTGTKLFLPSGTGKGTLNSNFAWPEICAFPDNQPLKMTSIVESDVCGDKKYDTLVLYVRIIPRTLEINLSSSFDGHTPIILKEEESLNFLLTGKVNASRQIQLSANGTLKTQPGFSFRGGIGIGEYAENFSFSALCGGNTGNYSVRFVANSLFCGYNYRDSLEYNFTLIYEKDSLGPLPNLITSNEDGKNDYFSLENILVRESCANKFDYVEIYNRWGKRIFFSEDKNFQWKPAKEEEGIFFYGLNFKNKRFSSWISVVN